MISTVLTPLTMYIHAWPQKTISMYQDLSIFFLCVFVLTFYIYFFVLTFNEPPLLPPIYKTNRTVVDYECSRVVVVVSSSDT